MADLLAEAEQDPKTTIWQEFEIWAQDFSPWQRFTLANAVRVGRLTDAQINEAYRQFLYDSDPADTLNPSVEIPDTISGRPTSAAPTPLWLRNVRILSGVNALPPSAELTFSPTLTVVYGPNGARKSGFTRILSNSCFSRAQEPILPNIYKDVSADPRATISIADGTQGETDLAFDSSTDHPELKRIAVFDTAVASKHLVDQSPLGFKPSGFDVFPEMARVYAQLASRLGTEIERRTSENTFSRSFVAPETTVSKMVSTLGEHTDLAELKRLGVFGETEAARLEEVQRQITELRATSVTEAVKQLENAKRDIESLKARLLSSLDLLGEEKRIEYRHQLSTFLEKARLLAAQGSDQFKGTFFSGRWHSCMGEVSGGRTSPSRR